ncbi:endonuclease domain-containing 1 protein-like [Seriola aureovittata]|uniref:endonuclease domain-containing 1 protein-like n=1 Tax=Seriola aureovittata TaxID=2871759 RepID=UPI0024BD8C54|nr:endonuclease domain-containing 1 protein-like [Seriola aureovittata]
MSQRKMLQFSTGALLLLLPWFGGLVLGEVVNDFSNCKQFFYMDTPPTGITGNDYQPICQRYNNKYRFATLYDRARRSALYSAYILSSPDGGRDDETWMYEPQLANIKGNPSMQELNLNPDNNVKTSQAVLEDYRGSLYTRGHLTPSMHQHSLDDRKATYTLTNIVPQWEGSNSGPWRELEEEVLREFNKCCKGQMYVITGVLPGNKWMNSRVSVPDYLWSAYCCPDHTQNLPECQSFFPTYAAVGSNLKVKPAGDTVGVRIDGFHVTRMSLNSLERILKDRPGMPIVSLFDGQCKEMDDKL